MIKLKDLLNEAISGSDRKIMMMIVRDIIENLKKAGAKKPNNAVGRGVLSILRAMTYTPDNANYKNYKKYFPRTFNSKLTQKRVKQFHTQNDRVQLTMVKQAMAKVLGEEKLSEKKFIPTITIEKYDKVISVEKFKSENDAKKYIRQMVKKYKLKKQKGFWGNPKTGIELTQNFG